MISVLADVQIPANIYSRYFVNKNLPEAALNTACMNK